MRRARLPFALELFINSRANLVAGNTCAVCEHYSSKIKNIKASDKESLRVN